MPVVHEQQQLKKRVHANKNQSKLRRAITQANKVDFNASNGFVALIAS